ncbi:MAG: tryptophan 7-halogenase [Anaerolineaceae bacterium]|nr:tryptophan 7-halogenase [Anaerolineaceae bacterium]
MASDQPLQDVVIIGGGPAGSTAATLLSKKGLRVTLLEKEKFPRDHVGESLLPFCYKIFEELGLLSKMKTSFVRKPGVRFVDIDGQHGTSWCFNRVIHDESYLSFQVSRGEFDKLLLDNSRDNGAQVYEETRVQSVELQRPDGTVEVRAVGPNNEEMVLNARFLLDASGRNAFLATRNGWRKSLEGLDRTALWTHWHGATLQGGLEEGMSLIVYLGGEKKGWIWVFPLGKDWLTVGVVLENKYIREQKSLLSAQHEDWQQALYEQELLTSPFVEKLIAGAQPEPLLRVEGNYSYSMPKELKFGANYALVGDASTFIDPIFSSGIFLSMNGSRLVSEAIHQKLTNSNGSGDDPLVAAYGKINGAYNIVHNLIRLFYNPHSVTFAAASGVVGENHTKHEDAMAAGHYLLAGDFFDRHEEYMEFIEYLQSPSLFEKFKYTIIDRKEFHAETCGASPQEVFSSTLDEQKIEEVI